MTIEKLDPNKLWHQLSNRLDNFDIKINEIIDWINKERKLIDMTGLVIEDAQSPHKSKGDYTSARQQDKLVVGKESIHNEVICKPETLGADTRKGCGKKWVHFNGYSICGDNELCEDCNAQHPSGKATHKGSSDGLEKQGKDSELGASGFDSQQISQPALCKCGHERDNHFSMINPNDGICHWKNKGYHYGCECEKFEVKKC